MKISETTILEECNSPRGMQKGAAATFISQHRIKHEPDHTQDINGLMGTLVYAPRCYYLRAEFGFGNVRKKLREESFSQTQSDDVLFQGGYTYNASERTNYTFSALFGIPTHPDESLKFLQFGYSHFGFGAELDSSFKYASTNAHKIHWAARYVHFLSRDVQGLDNASFRYKIPDLVDFLIFNKSSWRSHTCDVGYGVSWYVHPTLCPKDEDLLAKDRFSRSSFWATYQYKATAHGVLVLGFAYGFDHSDRPFDSKQLTTFWASWAQKF